METPMPLVPLEYEEIKKHLLTSRDELSICICLEALRWRISKTPGKHAKGEILHTYTHFDILGCNGTCEDIILHLLNLSRRVMVYTVFLINAMASEVVGRNYLMKHPKMLDTLFSVLLNEKGDTVARQHAVGAVQKFSLRQKCQSQMIKMEMIRFIIYILRNEFEHLSEYTLEYSTALLMNLSLRKEGKDKCEEPELELLHVLNELLENENA